jgi:hypothetical protein
MTTEHSQYLDQIPVYLAGGLSSDERRHFDTHIAICEACQAALDEAAQSDRNLQELFAAARPDGGFEERLIGELRAAPFRRRLVIGPTMWRILSGVAAVLVLAGVGYSMGGLIEKNMLPGAPRMKVAASSIRARQATLYDVDDIRARAPEISTPPDFDLIRNGRHDVGEKIVASLGKPVDPNGVKNLASHGSALAETTPPSAKPASSAPQNADSLADWGTKGTSKVTEGWIQFTAPAQDAWGYGLGYAGQPGSAGGEVQQKHGSFQYQLRQSGEPASGGGPQPSDDKILASARNWSFYDAANADGDGIADRSSRPAGFNLIPNPQGLLDSIKTPDRFEVKMEPKDGEKLGKSVKYTETPALGTTLQLATGATVDPKSGIVTFATNTADPHSVTVAARTRAGDEQPIPEAAKPADAPPPPPAPVTQTPPPALQQRKIIRNGEMEFEVDSFDSTFMNISKILAEEQGFVSSTNSEKLANGKVRGTIIVRVPPEHLDTLVLKLRALGDLKSQKISAQDVTKAYYDLEAELRGSKAMEERLLNIIKNGKGEVKDLIEAEKQYGVYREKSEKLEGEIRYYNSLISLSTLSITAMEKDIRTPVAAATVETVNMGIEAEDVEKTRSDAIKAIEEVKGRVIESNLKKHDAGKFDAIIVADVSPDVAGPLTDRLRQLGRVERFDIDRKQTTQGGTGAPVAGTRIEKRDTRFSISLYNLANLTPRQATNLSLAVPNVEEAYRSILESIKAKNGRILTSNLNRSKPEQTTAELRFEVPSADADATLNEIRRERDVMSMTVAESPNASSTEVTSAKRGFAVTISSLARVPARQTETSDIAVRGSLPDAFHKLVDEARKADARILVSQLNEQDRANLIGGVEVEVSRLKEADFRTALAAAGITTERTVVRSPDADNTVDSKVHMVIRLRSVDVLEPRDTQSVGVAAKDVPSSYQQLLASLSELNVHIINSQLNEENRDKVTGEVTFDVMAENREAARKLLDAAGAVYSRSVTHSTNARAVEFKTRMTVTLMGQDQLPPRETGRMRIEVNNVEQAKIDLESSALKAGGRVVEFNRVTEPGSDRLTAHFVINLPQKNAEAFTIAAQSLGRLRESNSAQKPDAPQGEFARAQFEIDLATAGSIVSDDEGFGSSVRHALSVSVAGLLWSLERIVIGVLVIGPWALIGWGLWKMARRKKIAEVPAATPAA